MKKTIIAIAMVVVLAIAAGFMYARPATAPEGEKNSLEQMQDDVGKKQEQAAPPNQIAVDAKEVASPATLPQAETSKKQGFNMADVAKNNTASSCWTVVRGTVYDLTAWIDKHPGGSANILRTCGKDGTQAFEGQHEGQSKPETMLKDFAIGPLVP